MTHEKKFIADDLKWEAVKIVHDAMSDAIRDGDITLADAATVRNLMQEYLSPRQKERLGNQLGAPLDELEVQWVRLGAWQSEKAIPPRAGKEESE